jgi:hypothetical protein
MSKPPRQASEAHTATTRRGDGGDGCERGWGSGWAAKRSESRAAGWALLPTTAEPATPRCGRKRGVCARVRYVRSPAGRASIHSARAYTLSKACRTKGIRMQEAARKCETRSGEGQAPASQLEWHRHVLSSLVASNVADHDEVGALQSHHALERA